MRRTINLAADFFHENNEVLSSDDFFEVNFEVRTDGNWREGLEYEIYILSIYLNTGELDRQKRHVMIHLPQLKDWIQPVLQSYIIKNDLLAEYLELETV